MLNLMICIFVWILGPVQSKICYNYSRNGVTESWFCCNNHEEIHGVCVECETGYVSKDGFRCEQCLPGRWGRKCRNKCICQHNERCHIVYGCVAVTTVMPERWESTKQNESSDVKTTDSIPTTDKNERWESTKQNESSDVKTTDSIPTTDKNDAILLKREIVIYSSAGSIAVIVALASFCLKYKRKAEHLYHSRSPRTRHQQLSFERANVHYNRNNESAYDLINEENMIGDDTLIRRVTTREQVIRTRIIHSVIVDQDGSSSSNSTEVVNNPDDEGYLNPYQPMVEADKHSYRTLADESTNKSEETFSKNLESAICSTILDIEHVPPYQTIKPFVDEHIFSPIDEAMPKYTTNALSVPDTYKEDSCSYIADADQMEMHLDRDPQKEMETDAGKNKEEQFKEDDENYDENFDLII